MQPCLPLPLHLSLAQNSPGQYLKPISVCFNHWLVRLDYSFRFALWTTATGSSRSMATRSTEGTKADPNLPIEHRLSTRIRLSVKTTHSSLLQKIKTFDVKMLKLPHSNSMPVICCEIFAPTKPISLCTQVAHIHVSQPTLRRWHSLLLPIR